jgi:hypothetical protein
LNAGNKDPSFDEKALAMAERFGLIKTAGADAHSVEAVRVGAMGFPSPLSSLAELVAALRRGEGVIVPRLSMDI